MRLTGKERDIIVEQARRFFGSDAQVMLFGSRTDSRRRGGDIDLLVRGSGSRQERFRRKVQFLVALKTQLGDQHIDVVLEDASGDTRPIVQEAVRQGVVL
ncbi:MAG: nucleotidyltransferase domain-containing protein [Lentisphaerae bacterium]|nr:nucleotidyltransferase domain-containing protein [Lentisphaerota bacterium]